MTVQSFNYGGKPAEAVYLGDIKLWPAGAPDLSALRIDWGTDTVLSLDLAAATIHGGPIPGGVVIGAPSPAIPAAANLRISPLSDGKGLRVQADAFTYEVDVTDGFMGKSTTPSYASYIEIPVTAIAHVDDARTFKAGGSLVTGQGIGVLWGGQGSGVPAPDLSKTTGPAIAWSVQRWVYPKDGTTGAVSLDVYSYPGAAVTLTSGEALRALVDPVVRFLVSTAGSAAETPVGHYSTGALALDVEVRPVLISQMPKVAP